MHTLSYRSLNLDYYKDVRVINMFSAQFFEISIVQYGKLTTECYPSEKQTSVQHYIPYQNCGSLIQKTCQQAKKKKGKKRKKENRKKIKERKRKKEKENNKKGKKKRKRKKKNKKPVLLHGRLYLEAL